MEGAAESAENEKEELTAKIKALEVQLNSQNELYLSLKGERDALKALFEREVEDSDDVVSVMRQNLEDQVGRVLELKERQLSLRHKIDAHEGRLNVAEAETYNRLAEQEEDLTRDVVVLQTKLLITESNLMERDKLLSEMSTAAVSMAFNKQKCDRELKEIEKKLAQDYLKIQSELGHRVEDLTGRLAGAARAQQTAALKATQEAIVATFAKFRRASGLMLSLLDQNGSLRRRRDETRMALAAHSLLAEGLARKADRAGQDIIGIIEHYKKRDIEKDEKLLLAKLHERVLKNHRKKLEVQLCETKDTVKEIKEDLRDQETYVTNLSDSSAQKSDFEERLSPLVKVAEDIVQKGTVELPEETSDSFERNTRLRQVAAILMESSRLQTEMHWLPHVQVDNGQQRRLTVDIRPELYETGAMGLLQRPHSSRFKKKE